MQVLKERFWKKVDIRENDKCWNWAASCRKDGYGQITRGRRNQANLSSHRVSWEIHFGEIPKDMHVLHKCDNKRCVNPHHLFLGTNADNMKDKKVKGIQMKGENVPSSKLTGVDVKEIRSLYKPWDRSCSLSILAKKYGVSVGCIYGVITKRTWAWTK